VPPARWPFLPVVHAVKARVDRRLALSIAIHGVLVLLVVVVALLLVRSYHTPEPVAVQAPAAMSGVEAPPSSATAAAVPAPEPAPVIPASVKPAPVSAPVISASAAPVSAVPRPVQNKAVNRRPPIIFQ
jgi:hypothetical protein